MELYINGRWISESEAVVPFQDGGFLYGDCLFETIRVAAGKPFRIRQHLERLWQGLNVIRLDIPWSQSDLAALCQKFINKNALRDGLLRLIISRGTITGSPWNFTGEPNLYLTGRPLSPLPELPVKIEFVQEQDYPIARFYPAIKSGNYLGNMLAKRDVEQHGAYEPIFINRDGFITEGAIRNVFFIRKNTLFTPNLELGVLPGVIRKTILEIATENGIPNEETRILYNEIDQFDEVFISSTGIGIFPAYWEGFRSDYVTTRRLRNLLDERLTTGN